MKWAERRSALSSSRSICLRNWSRSKRVPTQKVVVVGFFSPRFFPRQRNLWVIFLLYPSLVLPPSLPPFPLKINTKTEKCRGVRVGNVVGVSFFCKLHSAFLVLATLWKKEKRGDGGRGNRMPKSASKDGNDTQWSKHARRSTNARLLGSVTQSATFPSCTFNVARKSLTSEWFKLRVRGGQNRGPNDRS